LSKAIQNLIIIIKKNIPFGGRVFQQTIGIPMGTNCAPLLVDLFLHAYEADFLQKILKNKDRKLAQTLIPASAITEQSSI